MTEILHQTSYTTCSHIHRRAYRALQTDTRAIARVDPRSKQTAASAHSQSAPKHMHRGGEPVAEGGEALCACTHAANGGACTPTTQRSAEERRGAGWAGQGGAGCGGIPSLLRPKSDMPGAAGKGGSGEDRRRARGTARGMPSQKGVQRWRARDRGARARAGRWAAGLGGSNLFLRQRNSEQGGTGRRDRGIEGAGEEGQSVGTVGGGSWDASGLKQGLNQASN